MRRALDEGYEVRCTVRPRQNPADFLRDWGATTVKVNVWPCPSTLVVIVIHRDSTDPLSSQHMLSPRT